VAEGKRVDRKAKKATKEETQRSQGRVLYDSWVQKKQGNAAGPVLTATGLTDPDITSVLIYLGVVPVKGKKSARFQQMSAAVLVSLGG
jgi:hypothetical protein